MDHWSRRLCQDPLIFIKTPLTATLNHFCVNCWNFRLWLCWQVEFTYSSDRDISILFYYCRNMSFRFLNSIRSKSWKPYLFYREIFSLSKGHYTLSPASQYWFFIISTHTSTQTKWNSYSKPVLSPLSCYGHTVWLMRAALQIKLILRMPTFYTVNTENNCSNL